MMIMLCPSAFSVMNPFIVEGNTAVNTKQSYLAKYNAMHLLSAGLVYHTICTIVRTYSFSVHFFNEPNDKLQIFFGQF